MKVYATLEVSQNSKQETFDLDGLNLSQSEWENMTDSERKEAVTNAIYDLNDQPYWTLGSFETD